MKKVLHITWISCLRMLLSARAIWTSDCSESTTLKLAVIGSWRPRLLVMLSLEDEDEEEDLLKMEAAFFVRLGEMSCFRTNDLIGSVSSLGFGRWCCCCCWSGDCFLSFNFSGLLLLLLFPAKSAVDLLLLVLLIGGKSIWNCFICCSCWHTNYFNLKFRPYFCV